MALELEEGTVHRFHPGAAVHNGERQRKSGEVRVLEPAHDLGIDPLLIHRHFNLSVEVLCVHTALLLKAGSFGMFLTTVQLLCQ